MKRDLSGLSVYYHISFIKPIYKGNVPKVIKAGPKRFIDAALYYLSFVMSEILSEPRVVSGIGRDLPNPIH